MQERELQLGDMTRAKLLSEGVQRFVARDLDHPAARFYVEECKREQRAYEASRIEPCRIPSEHAMQLVLFSARNS